MKKLKVLVILMTVSLSTSAQEPLKPQDMEMTITRVFDAPLKKVWEAWTEEEKIRQWWGPEGFTAPLVELDFEEQAVSLVCMSSPEYGDMYNTWTYQRIVPFEQIDFVSHFTDKDRNQLDPAEIGMPPGIPKQVPHVITFKDLGNGKTELTVVEKGYANEQAVEISKAGMNQCLDKMARLLRDQ